MFQSTYSSIPEEAKAPIKKRSGWFQKIPGNVLLSPGGLFLVAFSMLIEFLDLIPGFFLGELILEIIFVVLLKIIVKDISFKSLIVTLGIERFDFLGICPTTLLKLFRVL